MSAVVEVWVSELGKLKEKVGAKKRFLWSSKKAKHAEGGGDDKVDQQQLALADAAHEETTTVRKERRNSSTLSEATVCLLMDRFVPW